MYMSSGISNCDNQSMFRALIISVNLLCTILLETLDYNSNMHQYISRLRKIKS